MAKVVKHMPYMCLTPEVQLLAPSGFPHTTKSGPYKQNFKKKINAQQRTVNANKDMVLRMHSIILL